MHGVKHLEEISAGWICASRTLGILSQLAKKWQVELPDEAAAVLARTDRKNGTFSRPSDPMVDVQQPVFRNITSAATATSQALKTQPSSVHQPPAPQPRQSTDTAYALPPYDTKNLQAQNQPSTSVSPRNSGTEQTMVGQPIPKESYQKDPSPSEMFGGVDQLIRETQDWIYRDSQQVATGFENWDDLSMDPLTWTNGVAPDGTTLGGMAPGTMPMTTGGQGQMYAGGLTANANAGVDLNTNVTLGGGYPMMQWLSNADDMATYYNEGAFYQ